MCTYVWERLYMRSGEADDAVRTELWLSGCVDVCIDVEMNGVVAPQSRPPNTHNSFAPPPLFTLFPYTHTCRTSSSPFPRSCLRSFMAKTLGMSCAPGARSRA